MGPFKNMHDAHAELIRILDEELTDSGMWVKQKVLQCWLAAVLSMRFNAQLLSFVPSEVRGKIVSDKRCRIKAARVAAIADAISAHLDAAQRDVGRYPRAPSTPRFTAALRPVRRTPQVVLVSPTAHAGRSAK